MLKSLEIGQKIAEKRTTMPAVGDLPTCFTQHR